MILSLLMTRTATAMSRWRTRRTSPLRRGAGDPQLCARTAHTLPSQCQVVTPHDDGSSPGGRGSVRMQRKRIGRLCWQRPLGATAGQAPQMGPLCCMRCVQQGGKPSCLHLETLHKPRFRSSRSHILINLREFSPVSSSSFASCRSNGGGSFWTRLTASKTAAPQRPRPCLR